MEGINYIKHLNGVFERFSRDNRLNPSHISLYVTLFQIWNTEYFRAEFYINRADVMKMSKIGSTATYHRCIKQLDHWKYILYQPSHNPYKGSKVKMFNFGTSGEQVLNNYCAQNKTSSKQPLIGITKHIQTKKNISKPENLKNAISLDFKNGTKLFGDVQFRDNLKSGSDKDYGEPL
ncbi:hypothetical protein GO009_16750 [Muricauda sp. TY007]|uniref:hypothetical protein n=1 Tax=Allomuricauda sp. TY007 TaxID=2683200 RepID=UPI0013C23D40|nr:hypothetical protein [Muricauda sp. TY007]NDV17669.1 hypothetical protein [Muricauda sp. TY007]